MTERDLNRSGVQPIYSQAYGGHAQDKIVWLISNGFIIK